VFMVEHNMTGQMNELIPLQLKKWMRRGGELDFGMVHVCRGIMSRGTLLRIPYQNPRHRSESVNIGQLYDLIYVLEDRQVIDVNKEFLGDDPELEAKIRYLGKITTKIRSEIASRQEALVRFGLIDRPLILMSLGRFGQVQDFFRWFIKGLDQAGLKADYQVVMVLDPYLDRDQVQALQDESRKNGVKVMPFTPDLVDLINAADLVVCRAGYNTINEILLTDTKAFIVAEDHAGGEQEFRAKSIPQDNVSVITAADIGRIRLEQMIPELLGRKVTPLGFTFDKYAIGQALIEDLEEWRSQQAHLNQT